jgi:Mannose-1-phosphate guanylyltransferase
MRKLNTRSAAEGQVWAIVLAAGAGTRLRSLTDDGAGNAVPKQFCSVSGGNIIVQPADRGTAIGILLPVLAILEREPHARLLILPSDHFVADESVLASAIRTALDAIRHHRRGVALLGMEADEPDPELGYIVAEAAEHAAFHAVRRFVEKPTVEEASRLCEDGALWNSFIVACRAESLIELYRSRCPDAVEILQGIELRDCRQLADAYRMLPRLDFSRQIATGQEHRLAVVAVPHCGWSDLGTAKHLARTLVRYPELLRGIFMPSSKIAAGHVNLAERLIRKYPGWVADHVACGAIPS